MTVEGKQLRPLKVTVSRDLCGGAGRGTYRSFCRMPAQTPHCALGLSSSTRSSPTLQRSTTTRPMQIEGPALLESSVPLCCSRGHATRTLDDPRACPRRHCLRCLLLQASKPSGARPLLFQITIFPWLSLIDVHLVKDREQGFRRDCTQASMLPGAEEEGHQRVTLFSPVSISSSQPPDPACIWINGPCNKCSWATCSLMGRFCYGVICSEILVLLELLPVALSDGSNDGSELVSSFNCFLFAPHETFTILQESRLVIWSCAVSLAVQAHRPCRALSHNVGAYVWPSPVNSFKCLQNSSVHPRSVCELR